MAPSSAGSAPRRPPSARLLYCRAGPPRVEGGIGEKCLQSQVAVRDADVVWAGGLHSGWNARMRFAPHLRFVAVGGKLKYSVAIQAPSLGGERPLSAWLLISTWNGMA